MPVVQSGRTPSGNARASTRSPLNVEISAKIPVRDLLGQCQATDWIGLRWAMVATGAFWDSLLVVASAAPIIPACRLVPHSLIQR